MDKIRYSEIFESVQGEGRFVGVPSIFFRTFGCNFHCHGFGQPRDKSKWLKPEWMPYNTMNLSGIKNVKDLPVKKYDFKVFFRSFTQPSRESGTI